MAEEKAGPWDSAPNPARRHRLLDLNHEIRVQGAMLPAGFSFGESMWGEPKVYSGMGYDRDSA